jgi:DnaK suppressor protein
MDKLQLNDYAAVLRAKESELLAGLSQRDGLATESEPDLFDEIQLAADRALVVQALDRYSTLLRDVRSALQRIEDRSYGYCLECEEAINPRRLAAVPWARFCLSCQEAADRDERGRRGQEFSAKGGAAWVGATSER